METIKFKTNIKCGICLTTVTPFLDESVGAGNWQVDTQNPDKVLTVQTGAARPVRQRGFGVTADTVKAVVQQAGFKAEMIPQ